MTTTYPLITPMNPRNCKCERGEFVGTEAPHYIDGTTTQLQRIQCTRCGQYGTISFGPLENNTKRLRITP